MPSTYDTPVFPGPVHAHWQATAASKGFDLIARIRDRYHLQLRCQTCSGSFTASGNTQARVSGSQVLLDVDGNGTTDITINLTGLTSATQLSASDFLFL